MVDGKSILIAAVTAAGAYAAYSMISNDTKVIDVSPKETHREQKQQTATPAKTSKKLVKGSPEAKAHMEAMREKAIAKRKATSANKKQPDTQEEETWEL